METAQTQQQLQRELEEKSLKLLEMQKKLMEQEQQFNRDRMQFFRAAQSMMQELSRGVRGNNAALSPTSSMPTRNPNAILDSMTKSMETAHSPMGGVVAPPTMPSPQGILGEQQRRSSYPMWQEGRGGVGGMAMPHLPQQQQQQQHVNNLCVSTNSAVSTSMPNINHHGTPSHSQPPHNMNSYTTSPAFPPSNNGGPLYGRPPAPQESRYHHHTNPMSCHPYAECRPSLAEHNMQFYQQQQQQDALFNHTLPSMGPGGGGLLQGNSALPPSSTVGGGGGRRHYPAMMAANDTDEVSNLDLADILNSTSNFST